MMMKGARVQHIRFGEGIVLARDQEHIRVRFANEEEKLFVYPDVFSSFMKCADPEMERNVQADLQSKLQAASKRRAEQAERLHEMQQRMAAEKSAARSAHRAVSSRGKTAAVKKNP